MYGYLTLCGYRAKVNGKWMLFATEEEAREYLEDMEGEQS